MMTGTTGILSKDERTWDEYVRSRPKLADWKSYKMMGAKTELAEEGKPGESIIDRLREHEPYYAFMHDQVVGGDAKRFLDMDDDEALLYAVIGEYGDTYGMDDIVLHTWPRIPFKDAEKFLNNDPKALNRSLYFKILCAKAMNMSIDSDEVLKTSRGIDSFFIALKENQNYRLRKWGNLDTFIETMCKYPHANIFHFARKPFGHEDDMRTIDHDYLYKVLLKPKSEPTEIPSCRWHDMSVRLVDIAKDQIRTAKTRGVFGHCETSFMHIMNNALSCFLGDVEEVSFLETVSAFINEVEIGRRYCRVYVSGSEQIRYDLLDPRIFDYLREYGPAFATPLFERVLDSAATVEQDE